MYKLVVIGYLSILAFFAIILLNIFTNKPQKNKKTQPNLTNL